MDVNYVISDLIDNLVRTLDVEIKDCTNQLNILHDDLRSVRKDILFYRNELKSLKFEKDLLLREKEKRNGSKS